MAGIRFVLAITAATGAIAFFAPTVSAEPLLALDPTSGRCNGTTTATGAGFPPNAAVELALALPNSDQEAGTLAIIETDDTGSFTTTFSFGQLGCDTLARTLRVFEPDHLTVYADQADGPDDLSIYTRANYELTSLALPPAGSAPPPSKHISAILPLTLCLIGAALVTIATTFRPVHRELTPPA